MLWVLPPPSKSDQRGIKGFGIIGASPLLYEGPLILPVYHYRRVGSTESILSILLSRSQSLQGVMLKSFYIKNVNMAQLLLSGGSGKVYYAVAIQEGLRLGE